MKQGEKLKITLESRGIDKTEAAKKMGISRRSLYQLFETVTLRDATLDKIKANLGISIHDMEIASTQSEVNNTQQKSVFEDAKDMVESKLHEKDRLIATLEQVIASQQKNIDFLEQERNKLLPKISQLEKENKSLTSDYLKDQKTIAELHAKISELSSVIDDQGKKISEYEFRIKQYEAARPKGVVAGKK